MKNIHILPTNKPSRLVKIYNDVNRETFTLKLDVEVNDSFKEYVNIYITSDEEIKKGDWVLNPIYKTVYKWIKNSDIYFDRIDAKKIILTTDQDLINDGVQDIDNEFLEWFVKNPSCESVEVENKKLFDGFLDPEYGSSKWRFEYKVIIPKEESKQELSLKINDEFLDTTSKEILYTLMEEFDNLVTENSSEETPKQEITIEEIEQQITLTEARGERVIKYLDKYKGQSIYNEIALAIEFGYQLKLEEDE